jgi:hypothetical protein
VEANNRGVAIAANGSNVPSWSFGQSFFFASTVVTTIGEDSVLRQNVDLQIADRQNVDFKIANRQNVDFQIVAKCRLINVP